MHVFPDLDDGLAASLLTTAACVASAAVPCGRALLHEVETEESLLLVLPAELPLNLEQFDQADVVRVSCPRSAKAAEVILALGLRDQTGLVWHDTRLLAELVNEELGAGHMLASLLLHDARAVVEAEDFVVKVGTLERWHRRYFRLIQALQVLVEIHQPVAVSQLVFRLGFVHEYVKLGRFLLLRQKLNVILGEA